MRCNNCKSHVKQLFELEEFNLCERCFIMSREKIVNCVVCDKRTIDMLGRKKFCSGSCKSKKLSVVAKKKNGSILTANEKKLYTLLQQRNVV